MVALLVTAGSLLGLSPAIASGIDAKVGQAADVASSAYLYRADRDAEKNPPEGWILLMQHLNHPYDRAITRDTTGVDKVLCGLLWEEVRALRRVELTWPAGAPNRPRPEDLALTYFDATDGTAHTWWNPRAVKHAGPPEVSADGLTYRYRVPVDTWGIVASVRGAGRASEFAVPEVHALVSDVWKSIEVEIEWGFDEARSTLAYDGRIDLYDGVIAGLRPLDDDAGTEVTGPTSWVSSRKGDARRGVRFRLLYIGTSRWRRVWPYHAQAEDVSRTILTLWTQRGNLSVLAADLEQGPVLAPEFGFFLRAITPPAATRSGSPARNPAPASQALRDAFDALPGVPGVRGWSLGGMPWFGAHGGDGLARSGNLTIPPRCAAMHPAPDRDVAAGWSSPIDGRMRIQGKLGMADALGGNGVAWSVVLRQGEEQTILARGTVDSGGSQELPAASLSDIAVRPGDVVALVLGARGGNHVCDTTIVDLSITELGGPGRVWDLAGDATKGLRAANPHPDAAGKLGVWRFFATPADDSMSASPSEPPFRLASAAPSARAFIDERKAMGLRTIRRRVREHSEQTWEGALAALHPGEPLPPLPTPPFAPAMEVDVPSERLGAQWKLGGWHILRRSTREPGGAWRFNDYPFGILASETYMILRALDLQGFHKEAGDGLDQWLRLPTDPHVVPGSGGHHPWALPDRPLGHFADGHGCLTHAEGVPGVGGHMDGVHAMGPGAIMFALIEHAHLTGDLDWFRSHADRMEANAQWILRQRRLLATNLPGGDRLWSRGLQPAHVVTPDSERMHMQFYESEAYYWLAVKRLAGLLALIDPARGARMDAEAEAYRKDLVAAVDRSIALTPVVPVRDGTYHSFIPFAPHVRGPAAGAWGWRRCQGHVGAIYWDTVQSAGPLISPVGLLSPSDPRVQGHLDVLEDRLLLENTKVHARTRGYDPGRHWFSGASWQYQCGLERHANLHLAADDPPNFLRSMLNQYAVDIMPGEYTFREHTTGGPPDKIYEEACFLERLRMMLVMEEGRTLWLARATPRSWLESGRRISVRHAPTHFGPTGYTIDSDVDHGTIRVTVEVPSRTPPSAVMLRLRAPRGFRLSSVTVGGKPWTDFDPSSEVVRLTGLADKFEVVGRYNVEDR
jgi:hypothetical protein